MFRVKPPFFVIDKYVFDDGDIKGYFRVLSDTFSLARLTETPFWACMQAGSKWAGENLIAGSLQTSPGEAEFLWNINTLIMYGVKGLVMFPMIQPYKFSVSFGGELDFTRNGIFGADGSVNRWYHYLEKASKHIRVFGESILPAACCGVIPVGNLAQKLLRGLPEVITEKEFKELIKYSGNAVIGCFDHDGKTILYVVNISYARENSVSLGFNARYAFRIVHNAQESYSETQSLNFILNPGDGVFVEIKGVVFEN